MAKSISAHSSRISADFPFTPVANISLRLTGLGEGLHKLFPDGSPSPDIWVHFERSEKRYRQLAGKIELCVNLPVPRYISSHKADDVDLGVDRQ
jgi:hypothetical protein